MDFADGADGLVDGIDFDDVEEGIDETKLKEMEEKFEVESKENQAALKEMEKYIRENKEDPTLEGVRLLVSLMKDETLMIDTIIGSLQGQQTNKINLKFMLAKHKILLVHFQYTMQDVTDFINTHEPADGTMYYDHELKHVLKRFLIYLFKNSERNVVEAKLDEEEVKA